MTLGRPSPITTGGTLLLSTGTAPDPQVSQLTRATAAVGLPVYTVALTAIQSRIA
jgi:hypothetical protein